MSKTSPLSKFSRNVPDTPEPEKTVTVHGKAARGTAKRPAVAVRVTQDDWRQMHEFALAQNKSLNALLIEGFQALQVAAGVPPIKGDR